MFVMVALATACLSILLTILILKNKYDKRLSAFQDSVLNRQYRLPGNNY